MSTIPAREEALFSDALAQPPAERAAFLAKVCGADFELLARLVALVAAHERKDSLAGAAPIAAALHDLSVGLAKAEEKPGDAIGHYKLLQKLGEGGPPSAEADVTDRVGRYKLLQKLGEGGCGVVWMAEQDQPVRRCVALKVIKLGMDTKAVVARFEAERQALAMMDHPNIAKVHDAGATEIGRPFFVMELVRGIPITKYCDENRLNPTARLELFIKVCHAVQHAHQKGIIHRDLKPSNILVTVNDGAPTPKVIDFGIAKATQGRLTDATMLTQLEQFIGTPLYMSPEQAEMTSLDIDTRSDIYSLGVLLYELLTGRPPFDPKKFAQAGVDQIRKQIREVEPPRPSARLSTLDDDERTTIARMRGTAESQLSIVLRGDLDWIVMRCIEKDRTRRYDTANGLAMDIQRYLRNEPVMARLPSTAYLLQKLIRRHRVGFAAGTLVIGTLAAGLGLASAALVRERIAHQHAVAAEQIGVEARINAERLLAFVLTDMGDQLDEIGQAPLLRKVAGEVLAYYEQLNPALRTRETRAAHALAMTGMSTAGWLNVGRSSELQLGEPAARQRLERSLALLHELERTGPLTPFMRVAYAGILWIMAGQYNREGRASGAVPLLEKAETLLEPALTDPQWGAWVDRFIIRLIMGKAFLIGSGRSRAAELRRALARVEDQLRSRPADRGFLLMAIEIKWRLSWSLPATQWDEARRLNASARAEAQELIAREPFLVSAHMLYALCTRSLAASLRPRWRFGEVRTHLDDAIQEFRQVAKSDPGGWPSGRYHLLTTLATEEWSRYWLHCRFGEFAQAEADLREAIAAWSEPTTTPETRNRLVRAYESLARLLAATGRDAEADQSLRTAEITFARLLRERHWLTDAERELGRRHREHGVRLVEMERLNWDVARQSAERSLHMIAASPHREDPDTRLAEADARRDLWMAAYQLNDFTKVAIPVLSAPLPPTAFLESRFQRVQSALHLIHARASTGERDIARAQLGEYWPEVEALFAAGPDYLFNQVQTARALSIRAEIDGTPAEKREWLSRAAGWLRPAVASGKLTRYEREVLLAGIERQLAALTGPSAR